VEYGNPHCLMGGGGAYDPPRDFLVTGKIVSIRPPSVLSHISRCYVACY